MNKYNIPILISIIIILFLSFFLIVPNSENLQSFCKQNSSCTLNIIKLTRNFSYCNFLNKSDNCFLQASLILNNSNICSNIQNLKKENSCYFSLAVDNENTKYCKTTSNSTLCYYSMAKILENSSYCKFSSNSSYCYFSFAVNNKNLTICNKTGNYKNDCITQIKNK